MTVTNPYYEFTPTFAPGTKARSEAVNTQFQALQTAFDFMPAGNDSITTGTATFAPETGSVNAYVVTMPDTRTTEQDGDEVIFFATHANTGAATLNVDTLGAKAFVRADGSALVANDLQNGLLYVARYDATNTRYQLVGPSASYLTAASASATAAAASQVAAAASQVSAAADAVIAQEWAANPEDDDITSSPGSFSALHWAAKAAASAISQRVLTDINTATPPTTEGVDGAFEIWDAANDDQLMLFGYVGSNTLRLRNVMRGGTFILEGYTSGGGLTTSLTSVPGGAVDLYQSGIAVARTMNAIAGGFQVNNTLTGAGFERVLTASDISTGGGSALTGRWLFDNSISNSAPNDQSFRFNTNTPSTVSVIRIDDNEIGGLNFDNFVQWTALGRKFKVYNPSNPSQILWFTMLAAAVDQTGYWNMSVNQLSGSTAILTNGTEYVLEFELEAYVAPGVTSGNQNSSIYWNGNYWASTDAVQINPATPPIGGRIRVAGSNSTDRTRPALYQTVGNAASGFVFIEGATSGQGFYSSTAFASSPDTWEFGHQGGSTVPLLTFTDSAQVIIASGAAFYVVEKAAAAADVATYGQFWVRNDAPNLPMYTDDAGVDHVLNSTVAGSGVTPFVLKGNITVATPATTEAITALYEFWDSDETDRIGLVGFAGSNVMYVTNQMRAGDVRIQGTNTTGTTVIGVNVDPDSITSLYYAGTQIFRTNNNGVRIAGSVTTANPPTTEAADSRMTLFGSAFGSSLADVGFFGSNSLLLRNYMRGGPIELRAVDAGGTSRTLMIADPDTNTTLYAAGVANFRVQGGGAVRIIGDINVASPPTSELVTARLDFVDADNTDFIGRVGFDGNNTFIVNNFMNGGSIHLKADNSANASTLMATFDPDATASLYYAGIRRLHTASAGQVALRSDTNTAAETRALVLQYQDGTDKALLGHTGGSTLRISNRIASGIVQLDAYNSGSVTTTIMTGNPDGSTVLYGVGVAAVIVTGTGIVRIRGSINTATPPTTEAVLARIELYDADGSDQLAVMGFTNSNELTFRNTMEGGRVRISGENIAGVEKSILVGDPDIGTDLYYAGLLRVSTSISGVLSVYSDGNTDAENRQINLIHQNGAGRASIGHLGGTQLIMRNLINGGAITLDANDAAGTLRTILTGDPDAATTLRGDTNLELQVAASETALLATANADVALYYNNISKFKTADETAADAASGVEVLGPDGIFYPAGFNVVSAETGFGIGNVTLNQATIGKQLFYDTATARSLLFNNDGNIPIHAMWSYIVGPSGGTLTGDGGTGVTITYWNGSGWTTTAAAGNITIGVGSGTIWKDSDTHYFIMGPNLA